MPQAASRAGRRTSARSRRRNSDFPWDRFDSAWYHQHNYSRLRDDDRHIIKLVRDFFGHAYRRGRLGAGLRGVDVGAGANLYPALSMLPFCKAVELLDFSESNIEWLMGQVVEYDQSWDEFWNALREEDQYRLVQDPRARLAEIARVEKANVFKLPEGRWDLGAMFFVAESLTGDRKEFSEAVQTFLRSLRPRAPFAAAFMKDSKGYPVGDEWFPAVAIDRPDVDDAMKPLTTGLRLYDVDAWDRLRPGYDGMILATGYRSKR